MRSGQWFDGMYRETSDQTVSHGTPFESASMSPGPPQRNQVRRPPL